MSGGSFNYLCSKDVPEILDHEETIEDMANALLARGDAQDAADETLRLLVKIRQMRMNLRVSLERLRPVWKAIEWHQSCDWGDDQVKEAPEGVSEMTHTLIIIGFMGERVCYLDVGLNEAIKRYRKTMNDSVFALDNATIAELVFEDEFEVYDVPNAHRLGSLERG